jgi:hypothetical protein
MNELDFSRDLGRLPRITDPTRVWRRAVLEPFPFPLSSDILFFVCCVAVLLLPSRADARGNLNIVRFAAPPRVAPCSPLRVRVVFIYLCLNLLSLAYFGWKRRTERRAETREKRLS